MPGRVDAILRYLSVTPLAVLPEKAHEVLGLLERRANGEQVSEEEIEAVVEAREARDRKRVPSARGVAVIPIFGTIGRRISSMSRSSGGFDLNDFSEAFDAAVKDEEVGTIILHADTPGGAVPGVDEVSRKIFDARDKKRIIAVADGLMCSAGLYIGSAAHEVVATPDSRVGSIGVFLIHADWSRYLENEGVKISIIKAGKHKAEGNPYVPLDDEARAHLQQSVDDYYTLFVNAFARNMGATPAAVRNGYGQGRALIAERAKAEGLVHRIATMDQVLAELGVRRQPAIRASTEAPAIAASEEASDEPSLLAMISPDSIGAAFRELPLTSGARGGAVAIVLHRPNTGAEEAPDNAAAAGAAASTPTMEKTMDPVQSGAPAAAAQGDEDIRAAERKRAADILALCASNNCLDQAQAWINEGLSADAVGRRILERQAQSLEPTTPRVKVGADREAERPFASLGEQLLAIRKAGAGGTDARLLRLNAEYMAASGSASDVPSDGGFVIQPDFARRIASKMWDEGRVLSRTNRVPIGENANALVRNRIKENSRTTGNRYGGVRVYRVAEASTVEGSHPKLERQRIELEKLMGLYYATEEILQDAVALTAEAETMFRRELTFVAENEIFRGTGSGECLGFLNSNAKVSVAAESGQDAATVNVANVANMLARLPARSLPTAAWFINQAVIPQLIQLKLGDTPVFLPGGNAAGGLFGTLFGLPIEPVEYCEALGTEGDIILADLQQYTTIDKRGVTWQESIHVRFIYDETAFKITYRFNGQPDWPESVTPFKGSDKISPFITLATRS